MILQIYIDDERPGHPVVLVNGAPLEDVRFVTFKIQHGHGAIVRVMQGDLRVAAKVEGGGSLTPRAMERPPMADKALDALDALAELLATASPRPWKLDPGDRLVELQDAKGNTIGLFLAGESNAQTIVCAVHALASLIAAARKSKRGVGGDRVTCTCTTCGADLSSKPRGAS